MRMQCVCHAMVLTVAIVTLLDDGRLHATVLSSALLGGPQTFLVDQKSCVMSSIVSPAPFLSYVPAR